ncbi:MAG: thermonuclease family protein [Candidatus Woykebacteria bacterium]
MKRKLLAGFIFAIIFLVSYLLLYSPSFISNKVVQSGPTQNPSSAATSILENEKKQQVSKNQSGTEGVKVTRVVDGDTIEIETGQKVRYIGIDTPETSDPRTGVQCFGKEATKKNRELVEGKRVRLEKDVSETDKYGRLLRYIFVPSPSSGQDGLVSETLVKEGFAFSSPYPPDIKYQDIFNKAEKFAKKNDKGLWGSCGFIAGVDDKQTAPETDCVIKGNIGGSGEKIYHLPGQRYYNQTVISEDKGERWFCTESAAQAAGWRKSKL